MNDDRIIGWEKVAAFLASDDISTPEEIRAELEAEGIDVRGNIESLRTMIRHEYQARLREDAEVGRAAASELFQATVTDIAAWPLEKLRQWFGEAEGGRFGADIAGLTLAYRNKEATEPTEAELRSLIADIISSKK